LTKAAYEHDTYPLLKAYGCPKEHYRPFKETSTCFDYNDISPDSFEVELDGVVEIEGRPILYILRDDSLTKSQADLNTLVRHLACRGELAYLAIIKLGTLTLVPCALQEGNISTYSVTVKQQESPSLIHDLSAGVTPTSLKQSDALLSKSHLRKRLFLLFKTIAEHLVNSDAWTSKNKLAQQSEVLAILGRTMFLRFLQDRGLIDESLYPQTTPECWFRDISSASFLCAWLDDTFNGDLLPLPITTKKNKQQAYQEYFSTLYDKDSSVFTYFNAFMAGNSTPDQLVLLQLLNFAHIPAGLLSEIYEDFAHRYSSEKARKESMFYTPRHIAATIVNQAFDGLTPNKRATAKVLDPASGAGVFLILCFRRLVKEQLIKNTTIDTATIRKILYDQIVGFDINNNALKLATLGLYLTAIEIDPEPTPVNKLKFQAPLMGNILFDVGENDSDSPAAGSIGLKVGSRHCKKYDIVLGNPPWSKITNPPLREAAYSAAINVIKDKLQHEATTQLSIDQLKEVLLLGKEYFTPSHAPDIAFIWRALEWCKADGIIAFAIHARILFYKSDLGIKSRQALFRALRVTGIVNCTDIRQTKVWDNVSAHFCLFFARNILPTPHDTFRFISPYVEDVLNNRGKFRIAPNQAYPISCNKLERQPYLLKTLFRGSGLDAEVINKIHTQKPIPLEDYLNTHAGITGYKVGNKSKSKGTKQFENILSLNGLALTQQTLSNTTFITPTIDKALLPSFNDLGLKGLERPRKPEIYTPPLVVIKKDTSFFGIYNHRQPLIFSETFYGVSTSNKNEPNLVATYIYLLLKSSLFYYIALLTSAQFGTERPVMRIEDIITFPVIPYDNLEHNSKLFCKEVTDKFAKGINIKKEEIDSWAFDIYDITESEVEVIHDTLNTALPNTTARNKAKSSPNSKEIDNFIKRLENKLLTLFEIYETSYNISIKRIEHSSMPKSWVFIDIQSDLAPSPPADHDEFIVDFCEHVAESEGASQILMELAPGQIRLARLAQFRYWTLSQARLCAQDVLKSIDRERKSWGIDK